MGDSGHLLAGTSTISTMRFHVVQHRWGWAMFFCVAQHNNVVVDVFCFWLLQWWLILFRYIQCHGLLFMLPLTTWECGIWGLSFGHDNTLGNSYMCAFIHRQPQSETSFLFQRMQFFVAGRVVDTRDHSEGSNLVEDAF